MGVTQAAREGDPAARRCYEIVGTWLGHGLAALASILDPACFVIGGLALSGIPPFSGFFSKDEILLVVGERGGWHWALYVIGYIGAFLTAIYTFRMIFRAFYGEPVPEARELEGGHLHHAEHATNPATGERLGSVPMGTATDVDDAVRACRRSGTIGLVSTTWEPIPISFLNAQMREVTIVPAFVYGEAHGHREFETAAAKYKEALAMVKFEPVPPPKTGNDKK